MAMLKILQANIARLTVGFLLLLIAIYLFYLYADGTVFLSILKATDFISLLLAFLLLNLLQIVGAWRLNYMFKRTVAPDMKAFFAALKINYIQQIMSRILPFRAGDAVVVYMIHRAFKVDITNNLAVYVAMRVWDLRILLLFLLVGVVGCLLLYPDLLDKVRLFDMILIVPAVALIILFVTMPQKFMQLFHSLLQILYRFTAVNFLGAAEHFIERTRDAYGQNGHVSSSKIHFLYAILGWLLAMGAVGLVFRGLAIDIGLMQLLVIFSLSILLNIIPIHLLGGIGIGEAGIAGILILFGYAVQESIFFALAFGLLYSSLVVALIPIYALLQIFNKRFVLSDDEE